MYNKKKATDKRLEISSGLNHSSSTRTFFKQKRFLKRLSPSKANHTSQLLFKVESDAKASYRKISTAVSQNPVVCPVHKKCGGCQYQGMAYKKQLSLKQRQANMLLGQVRNGASDHRYERPASLPQQSTCCFLHLKKAKPSPVLIRNSTHKVVPVESCLIDDEKSDAIIQTIRELLRSFKIKTYNEDSGYGLLRHVLIRRGFTSGEIMVVLVASSPVFPSKNNFVKALRKEHPEITTVILNVNDQNTSMVLGERNITLYGKGYIVEYIMRPYICHFTHLPSIR